MISGPLDVLIIWEAFETLSPGDQFLVASRFGLAANNDPERSPAEISKIFKIPIDEVEARIDQALVTLRRRLRGAP